MELERWNPNHVEQLRSFSPHRNPRNSLNMGKINSNEQRQVSGFLGYWATGLMFPWGETMRSTGPTSELALVGRTSPKKNLRQAFLDGSLSVDSQLVLQVHLTRLESIYNWSWFQKIHVLF